MNSSAQDLVVPACLAGLRVDRALARLMPNHSRSRIQLLIKTGRITAGGLPLRAKDKVRAGTVVRVFDEGESRAAIDGGAGDLGQGWSASRSAALHVVHADDDLIVVDKPAGLVVHPGAGIADGTLANALLFEFPELTAVPRAGIVHRLDKDTSGLLVIARNLVAHNALSSDIANRCVGREYQALVHGRLAQPGTINAPIGRHQSARTKMAVRGDGRHAITHYRILEQFANHTHLRLRLETGRTHQIRVHLQYVGHPIVGDPIYGRRARQVAGNPGRGLPRQALHAASLSLTHPSSGAVLRFDSRLPSDIERLRHALLVDTSDTGTNDSEHSQERAP